VRLCGDIGGTKVLLALVDEAGNIRQQCRLASADFASFGDLLGAYLGQIDTAIDGGCLAVAGPVAHDGRSAQITNLPWAIDCAALEARFGLGRLALINDFAGVALGVAGAAPAQLIALQAGEPASAGVKLAIGAGTGLGMAILSGQDILPSEGGHVGFAPQDETQARVWQALRQEHGRVAAERVISGPGLAAIHRVLTKEHLEPAAIAGRALAGEVAALRSVELFFSAYGAFAGDMALAVLARGGVYLAGGVTQRLLPLLAQSGFLAAFNAKAEHAELVRRMPVWAVTDAEIGLRGAAAAARQTPVC
jgi:glucokinase